MSGIAAILPVVVPVGAALAALAGMIGIDRIEAAFSAVGSAAEAVGDYVMDSWTTIAAAGVEIWYGVADVFGAVMGVIQEAASAVWGVVTEVWTGALALIGVQTQSFGATAAAVWAGVVEWTKYLVQAVQVGLYGAAYVVSHLGDTFDLMGAVVAYNVIKTGNQIAYVFTDQVPAYLQWFGQNWTSILTDAFNFTTTVLGNIAANVYEVFSNLPGLIAGTTNFSDIWTPLTSGFTATMTALPQIADRQAGPIEQALGATADAAKKAYGQGMGDYISQHMNKAADAASAAFRKSHDVIAGAKPVAIPKPKLPDVKPIKIGADASAVDAAKKSVESLNAVVTGSAESMKAIYAAQHGMALPGKGAKASKAPATSPAATPDVEDDDTSDAIGPVSGVSGVVAPVTPIVEPSAPVVAPAAPLVDVKSSAFGALADPLAGAVGSSFGHFADGHAKLDRSKYRPDGSKRLDRTKYRADGSLLPGAAPAFDAIVDSQPVAPIVSPVASPAEPVTPVTPAVGDLIARPGQPVQAGGQIASPDQGYATGTVAYAEQPQAAPVPPKVIEQAAAPAAAASGDTLAKLLELDRARNMLLQQLLDAAKAAPADGVLEMV